MEASVFKKIFSLKKEPEEKDPETAYNLWAATYDDQPDNLVLQLDNTVFSELIKNTIIKDKTVADIGCGTGRHWNEIYDHKPKLLIGYDVSEGMLNMLKKKFPLSDSYLIGQNTFDNIPAAYFDVIISTLALAHIKNVNETFETWNRILKKECEIILTDFHPTLLVKGGKRNFRCKGKQVIISNYLHPIESIIQKLGAYRFNVLEKQERFIDESVRDYYAQHNAMAVYNKFRGMPLIYGLHLKKSDAST